MEAVEKRHGAVGYGSDDQGRRREILAIDGRILAQGQRLDDLSRS